MDQLDRTLLAQLQDDATQRYAALARTVGLSAGAVHERVRKLRDRGVIRRTTVEIDPSAVGLGVTAFIRVRNSDWIGDARTRDALASVPEVQEAHIVAGAESLLLKVRVGSAQDLQDVLRRLYDIDGVAGTEAIVVLNTMFERSVPVGSGPHPEAH